MSIAVWFSCVRVSSVLPGVLKRVTVSVFRADWALSSASISSHKGIPPSTLLCVPKRVIRNLLCRKWELSFYVRPVSCVNISFNPPMCCHANRRHYSIRRILHMYHVWVPPSAILCSQVCYRKSFTRRKCYMKFHLRIHTMSFPTAPLCCLTEKMVVGESCCL